MYIRLHFKWDSNCAWAESIWSTNCLGLFRLLNLEISKNTVGRSKKHEIKSMWPNHRNVQLLLLIKKDAHKGTKFRVWLHAKVLLLLVEAKLTNFNFH